jgi:hypothetical protein
MEHENGRKCECSIFKDKNCSLSILTIHYFMSKLENSFSTRSANEWNDYFMSIFRRKIAFCAKLFIRGRIEYTVYTECSLISLVYIMRCFSSTMYRIDLITRDEYEEAVKKLEACEDRYAPNFEFYIILPWEHF